jgi:hypothetical protein
MPLRVLVIRELGLAEPTTIETPLYRSIPYIFLYNFLEQLNLDLSAC